MAVLMPCAAEAEGAYTPLERGYSDPLSGVPYGLVPAMGRDYAVREAYEGRVLSTGERNGYHDSDFTVTVWDDETDGPRTFVYATTRAPTYHLYAHVDAVPEIIEKAKVRDAYFNRRSYVMAKRGAAKRRAEIAGKLGVKMSAIRRLEAGMSRGLDHRAPTARTRYSNDLAYSYGFLREGNELDRVLQLAVSLKAGRLRSAFKKKLAQQVVDWLNDPEPRYATPLSKRQLEFV